MTVHVKVVSNRFCTVCPPAPEFRRGFTVWPSRPRRLPTLDDYDRGTRRTGRPIQTSTIAHAHTALRSTSTLQPAARHAAQGAF